MKKIALLALTFIFALSFTACGDKNEKDLSSNDTKISSLRESNENESTKQESNENKSTKTYIECFTLVEVGDSLEQVEEKIGFKGEETYDSNYATTYFGDVNDGFGVEVNFSKDSGIADKVKMEYNVKDITNEKTKVKDLEGLKAKIDDGVSYDDVKAWVGGVDGVLYKKDETANSYYWRGTDGTSLMADFSVETGFCTSYTGFGA